MKSEYALLQIENPSRAGSKRKFSIAAAGVGLDQ